MICAARSAAMPNPVMITLTGVEKHYGPIRALAPVDFAVRRGERYYISGPNGSGKSTLLRIIAGITRPSRGSIRFAGDVGPIAFVPQSGGFYPQLTLLRHIEIWCRLYNRPMPCDAAVSEVIERLGLVALRDRKLAQLSGGYQKLAVLACAFGVSPAILLLDEPLGGLDVPKGRAMTDLLAHCLPRLDLLLITGHDPSVLFGDFAELNLASGQS